MKALLLGPYGQLGSDIRAANAMAGDPLALVPIGRDIVDLSDIDKAADIIGGREFDVLINCSSYHKTDEVEKNAQNAFTINAHLVGRLAEICFKKRARFVHVSTDYVFGGQAKREPLRESDIPSPINVYGASKLMGESLVSLVGGDVLVLRVASLFGIVGASGKGGNFVETMIRIGKEKGVLRVVADQIMSPTATADIATALLKMLKLDVNPGVWHVVNSGAVSWHDFAVAIIERCGIKASVVAIASADFPTAAKRPPYSALDNGKLAAAVGSMPTWQQALDKYLSQRSSKN